MLPAMRRLSEYLSEYTAFARFTTRAGGCQTPLTERSSTLPVQSVLRNGIRIENIRPASLSITASFVEGHTPIAGW